MAQASLPTWVIALGSGGLVGLSTLILNLFKQLSDEKDKTTKRLKETYETQILDLKQELEITKQELKGIKNFKKTLEVTVDNLKREGVTPETNEILRRIEGYLIEIEANDKLINKTRNAADWVDERKKEWVNQVTKAAIKQYPRKIPRRKIPTFKQDMGNYLNWLHDSLYSGFFRKMDSYVKTPAIESQFPYRFAFQELREMKDFGPLDPSEAEYLQKYIEELARRGSD